MGRKKDTDYAAISARLRVMENRLLTRERMEQLIEAREDAECVKLMADCGYPELSALTLPELEASLAQAQEELFADLKKAMNDPDVLAVFQVKYDYHNAKALIKSQARDVDPAPLLVRGGRYDPKTLEEGFRLGTFDETTVSGPFREAVWAAKDLLATSTDPQRADFLLDKACYGEMLAHAKAAKSPFLVGYVQTTIDSLNLRAVVRALRAQRGKELLEAALLPGGTVDVNTLVEAQGPELPGLFPKELRSAAEEGSELLEGRGSMTVFERLCDNAVAHYVQKARKVPFGVEVVVGYLFARQSELTALRIILSGRLAGIPKDTIRERLREAYA